MEGSSFLSHFFSQEDLHNTGIVFSVVVVCMSSDSFRRLMTIAQTEGMTTPEYVYISYTLVPTPDLHHPWGPTQGLSQSAIENLKAPFERVKAVLVPLE